MLYILYTTTIPLLLFTRLLNIRPLYPLVTSSSSQQFIEVGTTLRVIIYTYIYIYITCIYSSHSHSTLLVVSLRISKEIYHHQPIQSLLSYYCCCCAPIVHHLQISSLNHHNGLGPPTGIKGLQYGLSG